jgi:hypothetical protein
MGCCPGCGYRTCGTAVRDQSDGITTILYKVVDKIDTIIDITRGKHIVVFLSASCPHCRLAAKKLLVFKKQSPDFPLIFVLFNNKLRLPGFYDDTKTESIPRILMNSREGFTKLTEGIFPRIFYVDGGTVVYETNYFLVDKNDIEQWLAGKDTSGSSNR